MLTNANLLISRHICKAFLQFLHHVLGVLLSSLYLCSHNESYLICFAMKKPLLFSSLCALTALTVAVSSCDKDTYRHGISVLYPAPVTVLFADQTEDSVVFTTFDSYAVTSFQNDWLKVLHSEAHPSKARIENNYYNNYICSVYLQAQPNTGDAPRNGYVDIHSFGNDWDETARAMYYQFNWHNISKPAPSYVYDEQRNVTNCSFTGLDSATQVVDTLRFYAYDKWTLTPHEGSFVKSSLVSGEAGYQTILLSVEPNTSTEERATSMSLLSQNGAKTLIHFRQAGIVVPKP